ncbi:hypothetical protein LLH00_08935 [bacterium]|nr:hypothetical protein [bacterium]
MKTYINLVALSLTVALIGLSCGQKPEVQEAAPAAAAPVSAWRVIGPGGGGGQFIPTVNPSDSNNVFIRCDMTGAYVTYDGARSWRMFNLRTVVEDFEFDPSVPNTVYACTRSALWRSEDRGVRWHLVWPAPGNVTAERMLGDHADQLFETTDGMPDGALQLVRVDPSDSRRIYVGLSPAFHRGEGGRGPQGESQDSARVFVSADRGASWQLLGKVSGRTIRAIAPGIWDSAPGEVTAVSEREAARLRPDGSGEHTPLPAPFSQAADCGKGAKGSVIYILAGWDRRAGGAAPATPVFRSDDRGATWVAAAGNLTPPAGMANFSTLATCESNPAVAYLSCNRFPASGSLAYFGILKTTDSGASWQWAYQATDDGVVGKNHADGWMDETYGPSWAGAPICLGVSPTDPNICYGTDYGTSQRTMDGGKWWEQVYSRKLEDGSWTSRGLDVTTCYGVHFDPFDSLHCFISYTDIGLFHSLNGGESWIHSLKGVPGPWINTCYWLTFDPQVQGKIWSVWGNAHDLPRPKMFRGDFSRFQGGVALSEDGGKSWRAVTDGMPANTVCTHVLLDPDSPAEARTLYVCGFGKGVFKSVNGGANWKLMNKGLSDKNLNAWRMERLPDGSLFLLIARGGIEGRGYIDGGLYVSRDGAASWKQVPLLPGVNAPNDLVVDPQDPKRMYLSCWPAPVEGVERNGGLLRTQDGGASWERVFDEDAHVYAAAVDPANPAVVIINTFDSAAFRSEDYGASWARLGGYNFKWGHRPVFDPHHPDKIFLTTFGGSVFYGPAKGDPGAFEDIVEHEVLRW